MLLFKYIYMHTTCMFIYNTFIIHLLKKYKQVSHPRPGAWTCPPQVVQKTTQHLKHPQTIPKLNLFAIINWWSKKLNMTKLSAEYSNRIRPQETSSPTRWCVMSSSHVTNPKPRDICCTSAVHGPWLGSIWNLQNLALEDACSIG